MVFEPDFGCRNPGMETITGQLRVLVAIHPTRSFCGASF